MPVSQRCTDPRRPTHREIMDAFTREMFMRDFWDGVIILSGDELLSGNQPAKEDRDQGMKVESSQT
ncbi:hypothetical protein Tsubulata_010073, partial [Turnera subulata]